MTAPTVPAATIRSVFPFVGCDSVCAGAVDDHLLRRDRATANGTGNGFEKLLNPPVN
jgi:hypothetical protein